MEGANTQNLQWPSLKRGKGRVGEGREGANIQNLQWVGFKRGNGREGKGQISRICSGSALNGVEYLRVREGEGKGGGVKEKGRGANTLKRGSSPFHLKRPEI